MDFTKHWHRYTVLLTVLTYSITLITAVDVKNSENENMLTFDNNVFESLEELLHHQSHPTYFNLFNQRNVLAEIKTPINIDRKIKSQISKYFIPDDDVLSSEAVSAALRNIKSKDGNVSQCSHDFEKITIALKNQEKWPIQMLDAWGWPSSGIFASYNPKYIGDFEYCLDANTSSVSFRSKWCGAQMGASEIGPWKFENQKPPYIIFQIGTCVPDSCQPDELKALITAVMSGLHPEIKGLAAGVMCQERDIPLTTKAKVIIAVVSVFAFLLVLGTVYDIVAVRKSWHCLLPRGPLEDQCTLLTDTAAGDSVHLPNHRSENEHLLGRTNAQNPSSPSLIHQLLMPFSVMTNTEKLLSTKKTPGTITCIHGIRFLSMTWVILGHSISLAVQTEDNVQNYVHKAYTRWTFQAILSALVSVDTFFTLSGLLMSYLVFKELKQRRPSPEFFAKFYFHRFWRLTPPYMLVLMTYVPLYKYIGDGPFWPQNGVEKDECENNWWTNLLYVNNLVKSDDMGCMGWTWYLANDMQFYVISPVVFIPMYLFGCYGLVAPFVLIVGSMISAGCISAHFDLEPQLDAIKGNGPDYMKYYYIKPWNRIGPYLVGMIVGYIMSRTECKIRLNKVLVTVGWMCATAVGLSVVYGLYEHDNGHPVTNDVAAFYNATHRTAWGMAVGWVIFACAHGYGGIVNKLLSWSAFIPLSRLTYSAYLIHVLVVYFYYFTHRKVFYAENTNIIFAFLGTLVVAFMVAYIVSMAYEAPFIGLEKALMRLFAAVGRLFKRLIFRNSEHNSFEDSGQTSSGSYTKIADDQAVNHNYANS